MEKTEREHSSTLFCPTEEAEKKKMMFVLDDWVADAQTVARMSKVLSEVEIKQMKTSNEMANN